MGTQPPQGPTNAAVDGADPTIAYVGGGSREWAPKFVRDVALSGFGGEVRLYDVDRESARRNARFGNWVQEKDAASADWTSEAVADLESAFDGADVVFLSTLFDPTETFVHGVDAGYRTGRTEARGGI